MKIACSVCGACAWPSDPSVRATFSLRYCSPSGVPTSASEPGAWFCELHYPPRTRAPRPTAQTAREVADTFERTLATEFARLQEAVDDAAGGAVEVCRAELERGLGEVRKAIAAHEPPTTAARPRRKPSPTVRLAGQAELVEASPAATAPDESEAAP